MIKKFSKFLLITLIVFMVSTSFLTCFADDEENKINNAEATTGTTEETPSNSDSSIEPEIHYGDLYIFDTDVVMDKLVDGNVFIFANKVEITGQINGSLFVLADTVYYNGACNDLYVAATNLEMTYDSYVARDVKAIGSYIELKSFVNRDVDLMCNTLNLGEGENVPIIYGDLRYTANTEVTVPENVLVSGEATYTTSSSIIDILIGFATCVVTALIIYTIFNKISPKIIEKISTKHFSFIKLLKAFVLGLVSIILITLGFILLVGLYVGIYLAFILLLLFIILCLIAVPTLAISITNALKPALKLEKNSMFYLILALISIILYGIALIPYVGGLLGFIINITSIGLIISSFMPHKELSDEEKSALEETKKIARENKEQRKQEKLEAKAIKKQEKLEAKENKKQNK